jgi:uncharacterized membrane protein YraQ (UPF0718 family)
MAEKKGSPSPVRFKMFGPSFFIFLVLTAGTGTACYVMLGATVFEQGTVEGLHLFIDLVPRFAAALLIAGFALMLIPRDFVARWVGENSGLRGVLIATVAGCITPGGPMMGWPVMMALAAAGADRGPLVAYVTSWALLGAQRIIVWELPLLGEKFVLIRFLASLLMPVIAGVIASRIPFDIARPAPGPDGKP